MDARGCWLWRQDRPPTAMEGQAPSNPVSIFSLAPRSLAGIEILATAGRRAVDRAGYRFPAEEGTDADRWMHDRQACET